MKRMLTTTAVVALLCAGVALAGQTKPMSTPEPGWVKGTISAWDESAKTMTVKDEKGKEWTFAWNTETKTMGTPKVGEMVELKYRKEKDGHTLATHVYVGKEQMEKAHMKGGKKHQR